jgi:hypothetical protein
MKIADDAAFAALSLDLDDFGEDERGDCVWSCP